MPLMGSSVECANLKKEWMNLKIGEWELPKLKDKEKKGENRIGHLGALGKYETV